MGTAHRSKYVRVCAGCLAPGPGWPGGSAVCLPHPAANGKHRMTGSKCPTERRLCLVLPSPHASPVEQQKHDPHTHLGILGALQDTVFIFYPLTLVNEMAPTWTCTRACCSL